MTKKIEVDLVEQFRNGVSGGKEIKIYVSDGYSRDFSSLKLSEAEELLEKLKEALSKK